MMMRSRFCGRPKSSAFSILQSASYPMASSVQRIARRYLPPLAVASCLTFSRTTSGGRFAAMIRAASRNSEPFLASAKPLRRPMMLNGWHGKPAKKQSWSGTSETCRRVTSPAGDRPKLRR